MKVNDKPVGDVEQLPPCPTDPGELATWLASIADGVLKKRIDPKVGQVCERIGATLIKAIELSRKPRPRKMTPEEQAEWDEMFSGLRRSKPVVK